MPKRGPRKSASSCSWSTHASTALVLLQRIVAREYLRKRLAKMLRQLLGDVHGAMLPAGAADCNGQVAAVGLGEFGDALLEERRQVRDHGAHGGKSLQVVDHGRVAAVESPQAV